MAGDRQHILPRFLLKGFASRIQGKQIYTWVYRSDGGISEPNITNAAVSRYFYGRKGELSVDDDITKFEGKYSHLLDELRAKHGQVELSDYRIANLVTHLVTRTKHFRDGYRNSMEFLVDKMTEYFSDQANLKEAILSTILKQPKMIEGLIEEGFRDHPELRFLENILKPLFPSILIAFSDTQKTENQMFVQYYFENIKEKLPKWMKDGHIKGLSQGLTPEPRVKEYQRLKWYLFKTGGALILGDIGCLFEVEGIKRFKSITFEDDEIKNIFLPISDMQILIGTSLPAIPNVDHNFINKKIAKCSREFFICSKNCPGIASLLPLLGSESEIISKEEIEQAVEEIILEYKVR